MQKGLYYIEPYMSVDHGAKTSKEIKDVMILHENGQDFATMLLYTCQTPDNAYRDAIVRLIDRQRAKGMDKYGQTLEENTTLTTEQSIEHAQEELVDALQYLEHLKQTQADKLTAEVWNRRAHADVVEVVRCKDCKWWHTDGCAFRKDAVKDLPAADDFCSYGERKGD